MEGIDSGRIGLLEALKRFTSDATGELLMPVRIQKQGEEQSFRAAEVFLMRLPDSKSVFKKAPYILHQFLTGQDEQKPGQHPVSIALVRSVFCVYNDDEQEGGLMLLNLMERLRIALEKQIVIEKRYKLLLDPKMETLVYPEDYAPYFAGEVISAWKIPVIEREARELYE
ncbi:MAG: hypothetical protein IJT94_13375 [Oscillibacter sp.]|nr:hypothetical protein [Oscillibacter sp.]